MMERIWKNEEDLEEDLEEERGRTGFFAVLSLWVLGGRLIDE
jgi:hypothetical protein